MSQQQSYSSSSYSSYSYSSSSTDNNGQVTGQRSMHSTHTDPSGTTVQSASQNLGQPVVHETRRFDPQGRELLDASGGAGGASRRIEDVSDEEQARRDKEYEERIEEEYAKREGGA